MSFKGFQKAVARLPHLVMAKSGYTTETVDPEFQDLEERFKILDAAARKLSEDARKFKDALVGILVHQESFAETLLETYMPIAPYASLPEDSERASAAGRTSASGRAYQDTPPEALYLVQAFAQISRDNKGVLTPDLEVLERRLVAPSMDLVQLLDNVKKWIVKRSHKLLDYDRHRETVKKLKEKENRTVADEKSLGRAEVTFDQATREYESINLMLKSQLPLLLRLKADFVDPCFRTLYWYQRRVHTVLADGFRSLGVSNAPSAKLVQDFETQKGHQEAMLEGLTVLVKNRLAAAGTTSPGVSPTNAAGQSALVVSPKGVIGGYGAEAGHASDGAGSGLPAYTTPTSPPQFASFKQMHAKYGTTPVAVPYGSSNDAASRTTGAVYVKALYDYQAQADGDLSFQKDDVIEVVQKSEDPNDWWTGKLRGVNGIFPGNYVEILQ